MAWSSASVGGSLLSTVLPLEPEQRSAISTGVKNKALDIINVKGFTSYGVAAVVTSICESILFDQRHVRPLSHWQEDLQCCLSLPAILGRGGISWTIQPKLDAEERALLETSAARLKDVIEECKLKATHD